MSKEREAELKALSERVSDAMVVDTLDDDFWAKAGPSPFYNFQINFNDTDKKVD